jgi:pilus assembly protein TadC
MERELPAFVQLLAVALESGCDVAAAIRIVAGAMPGPAARLVDAVSLRLSLGVAPAEAWRPVLEHAELAPLGRSMVRAHRSGTSVVAALGVLADELESRTRQRVEERARSVGVKAALPLGLCLLPSFLLIGIVPMAVSLLRTLSL